MKPHGVSGKGVFIAEMIVLNGWTKWSRVIAGPKEIVKRTICMIKGPGNHWDVSCCYKPKTLKNRLLILVTHSPNISKCGRIMKLNRIILHICGFVYMMELRLFWKYRSRTCFTYTFGIKFFGNLLDHSWYYLGYIFWCLNFVFKMSDGLISKVPCKKLGSVTKVVYKIIIFLLKGKR